jgi:hypothetical protein
MGQFNPPKNWALQAWLRQFDLTSFSYSEAA